MALQSAWLLTQRLIADRPRTRAERHVLGLSYAADWRRNFAPRLRLAALIAECCMRPSAVRVATPFLHQWPGLLSWGAQLSGKVAPVI
jgi:hypothetical protein